MGAVARTKALASPNQVKCFNFIHHLPRVILSGTALPVKYSPPFRLV
jgi:hypothetical protein